MPLVAVPLVVADGIVKIVKCESAVPKMSVIENILVFRSIGARRNSGESSGGKKFLTSGDEERVRMQECQFTPCVVSGSCSR